MIEAGFIAIAIQIFAANTLVCRYSRFSKSFDARYSDDMPLQYVWRSNLVYIINKYDLWSKYEAEGNSVMIAYASIYGNTENAAYYLANELSKLGGQGYRHV